MKIPLPENFPIPNGRPVIGRLGRGLLLLVWLALAVWGVVLLWEFSLRPGESPAPAPHWPAATRLESPGGKPSLVVFLHPHCPCSRATVGELAVLLARIDGELDVRAVFGPEGKSGAKMEESGLWKQVSLLPEVRAVRDEDGEQAKAFGAATSGDAFLFNAAGDLIFRGGLTVARGHEGDNPGVDSVVALLTGKPAPATTTPVFGCALTAASPPPRPQ